MSRRLLIVLLAVAPAYASNMDRAPRLELTVVRVARPAWAGAPGVAIPTHEVRLRLLNPGDEPVEAAAPLLVVPTVIDAAGNLVTFTDWRNLAGYAPPQPPAPPEPPVRRGESRLLATYSVSRSEKTSSIAGPYGNAQLAPGRYRVKVALRLVPITREAWVAAFRAAPSRRGVDADRQADRFAAHWREVASYWHGNLESDVVELEVE